MTRVFDNNPSLIFLISIFLRCDDERSSQISKRFISSFSFHQFESSKKKKDDKFDDKNRIKIRRKVDALIKGEYRNR